MAMGLCVSMLKLKLKLEDLELTRSQNRPWDKNIDDQVRHVHRI